MMPCYNPPPSVAFEREISWFLKEQVVVEWRDVHGRILHLGQLSPRNNNANLYLWAGQNTEANLLVVMLHLRLTYYVSNKRKKIDVFMPLSDLSLDSEDPHMVASETVSTDISQLFQENGSPSRNMRLLRLTLSKSSPCQVIMPIRHTKNPKPVRGMPEHLLLLAKTVSEASSFDAYLGYSTYANEGVRRVNEALQSAYTTPRFCLGQMYDHNGGGLNLWDDYLDTTAVRKASDIDLDPRPRTKRRREMTVTEQEPDSPPAYAGACTTSPQNTANHEDCVHKLPEVEVPASDSLPSPQRLDEDHDTGGDLNDVVLMTPQNPVQGNNEGDALIEPIALEFPQLPPPPIYLQRSNDHALKTPMHDPLDSKFVPITKSHDIPAALQQSLINWVFQMRKVDRLAHEIPEMYRYLSLFGLAVQRGNVTHFVNLKAKCTSIVLKRHVTSVPNPELAWKENRPERRVQTLICWMCKKVLDAELELVEDLTILMQKAVAWEKDTDGESIGLPENEKTADLSPEEDYMLHEATCIANFFIIYGHILIRSQCTV